MGRLALPALQHTSTMAEETAPKAPKDKKGSSRQAILKYVVANNKVADADKAAVRVKLALRELAPSSCPPRSPLPRSPRPRRLRSPRLPRSPLPRRLPRSLLPRRLPRSKCLSKHFSSNLIIYSL